MSKTFDYELKCQEQHVFFRPAKKPDLQDDYSQPTKNIDKECVAASRRKDLTWCLSRLDIDTDDHDNTVNIMPESQTSPSWKEYNAKLLAKEIQRKRVGFLPVLPYPVTQHDTVYTALLNFNGVLQQLDQKHLPVTCDEGVFRIAREIQLICPEQFSGLILLLSSFHMSKVALGCVGKFLKGSGAETILVESEIFGTNVVESVMNGKNYSRSLKGMQLLKEALVRLQFETFFVQEGHIHMYREQLDALSNLKSKFADSSCKNIEDFGDIGNVCDGMLSDFDHFVCDASKKNETFKFWNQFIDLFQLVENLVRADREGNWGLHLLTVQSLLPVFAAFDSTNYLRWCSLYFKDIKKLPDRAPEIYQAFENGSFAVRRGPGKFNAVGADMALEQTINRSQKSASGIIGCTRKKKFVAMWELIYHEMLSISNLHREMSGVYTSFTEPSTGKSDLKTGEKNVQAIINTIKKNENPFKIVSGEAKLHNILTQEVMSDEVRNQLLSVVEIGEKKYDLLRKLRFVDKSVRFSSTIQRTNLKTFLSIHSDAKDKKKSKEKSKNETFTRDIEIAKARGRSMEELLQYDISPKLYLFDKEGLMTKAAKHSLVHELELKLDENDAKQPSDDLKKVYIYDVMGNIRKLKSKQAKTFDEFANDFISYATGFSKGAERIDLIFDSYLERSPKDCERQRRQETMPIKVHNMQHHTPLPKEMDKFWSSNANKLQLEELIHSETIERSIEQQSKAQVVVSYFNGTSCFGSKCISVEDGVVSSIPELDQEIEEADERIIPHVMHSVKCGIQSVVVLSGDSDVFVLLMHYWHAFYLGGLKELWIRIGIADTTRLVPIHILAPKVGESLCFILPLVHTLTGCDYTSKIGTKHAALLADPVTCLQDFDTITEEFELACEKYLVHTIKKNTTCTTMDELRSEMYHHRKGITCHELPPTSYAVHLHIKRAYYATFMMKTLLHPNPAFLDPRNFGCEIVDELMLPSKGVRPIPEMFTVTCSCKQCGKETCSCRKAGLPCTKFCKCHNFLSGKLVKSCKNPFD